MTMSALLPIIQKRYDISMCDSRRAILIASTILKTRFVYHGKASKDRFVTLTPSDLL